MGDVVIVAYRPRPGREDALLELTRDHVPALRRLGLATDRPALAMRSLEGVIVEVFEWRDGAIDAAHENPAVLAMWERYAAVCDYVPLQALPKPGTCSRASSRSSFDDFMLASQRVGLALPRDMLTGGQIT